MGGVTPKGKKTASWHSAVLDADKPPWLLTSFEVLFSTTSQAYTTFHNISDVGPKSVVCSPAGACRPRCVSHPSPTPSPRLAGGDGQGAGGGGGGDGECNKIATRCQAPNWRGSPMAAKRSLGEGKFSAPKNPPHNLTLAQFFELLTSWCWCWPILMPALPRPSHRTSVPTPNWHNASFDGGNRLHIFV